jgi:hypothetical protein
MNERIKVIAEQAGTETSTPAFSHMSFNERFAELIIKEGVKIFHTEMFRLDALQGREIQAQSMETAAMMLKKHFGVE